MRALLIILCTIIIQLGQAQNTSYLDKGIAAFNSGDLKSAKDYFDKAILKDYTNATAYYYRGEIYFSILTQETTGIGFYTTKSEYPKLYQLLIDSYSQAIKFDSELCDSHFRLGLVYNAFQQAPEAIKNLKNAISCAEGNDDYQSICYNSLGLAYQLAQDHDEAIQCYQKALALNASNFGAHANIGLLYMKLGQYHKAIKAYEDIMENHSTDPMIQSNYAYLHTKIKEYKKAIELYNPIIEEDPTNALAYNNRGFAKLQLGKVNKAMQDIEKSLELYPSNSYAVKNKGLVYVKKGDIPQACSCFKKAEELGFTKLYGDEINQLLELHCPTK